MKKYLLFCFVMLSSHLLYARADTVYYNKYQKETGRSKDVAYYRVIKPEGSHYTVTEYFLNGKVQMKGTLSSLKPQVFEGMASWYSEDGSLERKGLFKNNKKQDHFFSYYKDGKIKSDVFYEADTLNGAYKFYYPGSQLKRLDVYMKGKFISGRCYTSSGADTAFYSYLQAPEFTGGIEKLKEYITANLVYPSAARRREITGIVHVKFIVRKDGEVTEVALAKSVEPILDKQALEVVRSMPNWKPGKSYEEYADFVMILPVQFQLED